MKTLKKNQEVIRVKNELVNSLLSQGYSYTNKKEWKDSVRDINKVDKPVKESKNAKSK